MKRPTPARDSFLANRHPAALLDDPEFTGPRRTALATVFALTRGGGRGRLRAMTGASRVHVSAGGELIRFNLPTAHRRLEIRSGDDDLYRVTVSTYRGRETARETGIYADDLADRARALTGVHFHL